MRIVKIIATLSVLMSSAAAPASHSDKIDALLVHFLAHAHVKSAHETFWADELVYTSSDGSRFGKADILSGFDDADSSEEPTVIYSGDEVSIRIFADTAVVTFRLIGTPQSVSEEQPILYFYNTGTLVNRDGRWQVVAWQATKIPPAEE